MDIGKPPEPLPGTRLLFSLDWSYAHLNHGSFGAMPIAVQRAAQRLRDEQEADPMRFFTRGLLERIAHARGHVARFVGAEASGTAFVPNVTVATAIALASVALEPGDEVLRTDHAYGAVAFEIDRRCAETGATPVRVTIGLDADDDEILAAVLGGVTPRTRVAVIDHVTSPTARLFPVRRLVAELRQRDVVVMVDGAHAPGMLDVDVAGIGADFWFANLHKWAFAPRGTGLLVVAPEHRARVRPVAVSWQHTAGFPASVEYQGTVDYSGWLAAPSGVFTLTSLGLRTVREHNTRLARYGQRLLTEALGTEPVGGSPAPSMRVVRLPDGTVHNEADAIAVREKIAAHLRTHVAIGSWQGTGLLRLCAQVYNRAEEYERLAAALPAVLRRAD
ncbi:MAG: aminotransferase class V-fold PLP-dependent enzyme [Actinocatenispora sp.]